MVEEFKLELTRRGELGKQAVKRLRREGKIPGVFYAPGVNAIPFSIEKVHLRQAFLSRARVYAVTVGGKKLHAIFKEIQYHPVTDEVLHVDLFGIRLKDKIDIMVPIILEGESPGVKMGGIMAQNVTEVEIRCLASEVPRAIHVDITKLGIGESIHVGDLGLTGVEVVTNPDVTVVSVIAPRVEVEVPMAEEVVKIEEEGEAEAEGAEAPVEGKDEEKQKDKRGRGQSE